MSHAQEGNSPYKSLETLLGYFSVANGSIHFPELRFWYGYFSQGLVSTWYTVELTFNPNPTHE